MNAMASMNELGTLFFALQKQSVLLFTNKSQYLIALSMLLLDRDSVTFLCKVTV